MIATAALFIATGLESLNQSDYGEPGLLDVLITMAFDLTMTSLIFAPEVVL